MQIHVEALKVNRVSCVQLTLTYTEKKNENKKEAMLREMWLNLPLAKLCKGHTVVLCTISIVLWI